MNDTDELLRLLRLLNERIRQSNANSALENNGVLRAIRCMRPLWRDVAELNYPALEIINPEVNVRSSLPTAMKIRALEPTDSRDPNLSTAIVVDGACGDLPLKVGDLLVIVPYVEKWIDWLQLKRSTLTAENFVYRLARASIYGIQGNVEGVASTCSLMSKKDRLLLRAAVDAGLAESDWLRHEVARVVIQWISDETDTPLSEVIWMSVDEAIDRLRGNPKNESDAVVPQSETTEESLADRVAGTLRNNSYRLFQRLRKNSRFIDFDVLRAEIYTNGISDQGINKALDRLSDDLMETPFEIQRDNNRVKLIPPSVDRRIDK